MQLGGRAARVVVALAGLAPFAAILNDFVHDELGPDPVEALTHRTGAWALRLLVLCLCVTPARRLLGWHGLAPHRRTLGLLACFYACLHFVTYVVLEIELDPALLYESVSERPFVTVGLASLLAMLPLAATSTRRAIRRLGASWVRLHRLAYAALVLAVLHFAWGVKADLREPLVYAGATAILLGLRLYGWSGRKRRRYANLRRSPEIN